MLWIVFIYIHYESEPAITSGLYSISKHAQSVIATIISINCMKSQHFGDEDKNMTSLGKIEEFNPSQTNISRYLETLEQYFEANDVPEDSEESKKR